MRRCSDAALQTRRSLRQRRHRWLHCNPSARLELEFADRQTEAAAEGTAAHALAEHKIKKALKLRFPEARQPV